jgi:hypothetical protein
MNEIEETTVKRLTMSVMVLAMVVGLGAGVAEAGKGNKGARPDRAAKRAETKNGIAGLVGKVDGNTIMVQMRGKKAGEVSVTTDANTKFEGVADIKAIKEGMRVVATPTTGTAQKVVVQPGRNKAGKGAGKGAKKAAKI